MSRKNPDLEKTKEREEAWVGDAVLALFAREWILREKGRMEGEMFIRFTSNDFLRGLGNPTTVEAEIGRVYRKGGLEAGFAFVQERILPEFERREKARERRVLSGEMEK